MCVGQILNGPNGHTALHDNLQPPLDARFTAPAHDIDTPNLRRYEWQSCYLAPYFPVALLDWGDWIYLGASIRPPMSNHAGTD